MFASDPRQGQGQHLRVRSSKGDVLELDVQAARLSMFLCKEVARRREGFQTQTEEIVVANVRTAVLHKVFEYCRHYAGSPAAPLVRQPSNGRVDLRECGASFWDIAYMDDNEAMLGELMLAAWSLDVAGLIALTSAKVTAIRLLREGGSEASSSTSPSLQDEDAASMDSRSSRGGHHWMPRLLYPRSSRREHSKTLSGEASTSRVQMGTQHESLTGAAPSQSQQLMAKLSQHHRWRPAAAAAAAECDSQQPPPPPLHSSRRARLMAAWRSPRGGLATAAPTVS